MSSNIATIVYTKTLTGPPAQPENAAHLGCWRVAINIIEATGINKKIFVYKKGTPTTSGGAFSDYFYSVASLYEIESLPEDAASSGAFYRSSSVDLVFQSSEEASAALAEIESLIEAVRLAASVDQSSPVYAWSPAGSVLKYYGVLAGTSATDEQLLSLSAEEGVSKDISKNISSQILGYVYFAYRQLSGSIASFKVNGNEVPTTLVTRNVVNSAGHSAVYNIYRTNTTFTGNIILEVS